MSSLISEYINLEESRNRLCGWNCSRRGRSDNHFIYRILFHDERGRQSGAHFASVGFKPRLGHKDDRKPMFLIPFTNRIRCPLSQLKIDRENRARMETASLPIPSSQLASCVTLRGPLCVEDMHVSCAESGAPRYPRDSSRPDFDRIFDRD
jgi:hypothetical protein